MTRIRVMTFNIQGAAFGTEGINSWPNRASLNARVILRVHPDVIGMQEVTTGNMAFYQRELSEYEGVPGAVYGEDEYPAYNAIYWNTTTCERLDSGTFWLSETPNIRSTAWGVPYPMVVNWVKLRRKDSDVTFLHYNTHLEDGPAGEQQRVESSKLIVARIQNEPLPVMLTGDFNCNPDSAAHQILRGAGFIDTYLAAGNKDGRESTFHGFEGPAYDPRKWAGPDAAPFWRVDWVLVHEGAQHIITENCGLVRDAEPPQYPSDHYPVLADLLFKG